MFARNRVSGVGVVIAGVALGWATSANAQASATSQSYSATAQQQADAARQRATELASAGGWAYKTGLVARAQRDAVRDQEQADRAVAEPLSCAPSAPPSPTQEAALARLEELRHAGGWAYKTGAVARTEREAQTPTTNDQAEAVTPSPEQAAALARLEELRHAGGWAYKTGAVARAEHEVQTQAVAQPTPICEAEKVILGS